MAPAQIAANFANALFLHPDVARVLVSYWLRSYVPLPGLGATAVDSNTSTSAAPLTAREAGLAAIHGLVRRLLAARPYDLQMCGQPATLPTPDTTTPVPLFIWHVIPPGNDWSLTVPDHYVLRHVPPSVAVVLASSMATMARSPEAYWDRVTGGGMRGPIMADTFRHGATLTAAYVPELMVAHVYAAILDALVWQELTAAGVTLYGATLVRALALPLREAGNAAGPVIASLADRLDACTDPDTTCREVKQLVANLDQLALQAYTQRASVPAAT